MPTQQEAREALQLQVESTLSDLAAWRSLASSPGWGKLLEYLRLQRYVRTQELVLKPLPNADAVYTQEFVKGEAGMLLLVENMPSTVIEALEANLEIERQQLENLSHEYGSDDKPIRRRSAP